MEDIKNESFRYYLYLHKNVPTKDLLNEVNKLNHKKSVTRTLTEEVFHSCRMDAISMRIDDVQALILGEIPTGHYEDRFIPSARSLIYCIRNYYSIPRVSSDLLISINKSLTNKSKSYDTRKLDEICDIYNSSKKELNDIFEFVLSFLKVSPFKCGNGRMSRLLMNGLLQDNNYPRLFIDSFRSKHHYKAVRMADKLGDVEPYLRYCLINLKYTLHRL